MKSLFIFSSIVIILSSAACSNQPAPLPSNNSLDSITTAVAIVTLEPTIKPTAVLPTSTPSLKSLGVEVDVVCSTNDEQARAAYNAAIGFEQQQLLAQAEQAYRQAISLDSKFCDAMDNLGRLLRRQNHVQEAISWYQKSLAIVPTNTLALQNLGVAYRTLKQYTDALAQYQLLIKIAPDNAEGYYGVGSVYLEQQQFEPAATYFLTAEQIYKENGSPYVSDAQYSLGFSFYYQQNCVKALDYFTKVEKEFQNDPGMNYALGTCYLTGETKNVALASQYILKAQQLGIEIPQDVLDAIK